MEPNGLFRVWSPDAAAECLEGIPQKLYQKLWRLAESLPRDESEVPDNFESRCLAKVWDQLTEQEQQLLNERAEATI